LLGAITTALSGEPLFGESELERVVSSHRSVAKAVEPQDYLREFDTLELEVVATHRYIR